jgi:hypothetical protein
MRPRPKPPLRVSKPPTLSFGIVVFGALSVLAAAGALVRYYARSRAISGASTEAGVEIPAPELEPWPAPSPGPTKP